MDWRLFLHEEILLIALRDREGAIPSDSMLHLALAGAIAAELVLRHRISVERRAAGIRIIAVSAQPVGEPLLDECLAAIAAEREPATAQAWIAKFAATKQLMDRVAAGLCERAVLRKEEGKIPCVCTTPIYPEENHEPGKRIMRRLSHAIFGDSRSLDPRTIALVSLAHHTGLLSAVFGSKETRHRKTRIDQITRGEKVGKAVEEAIESSQSTILVSSIVASIAIS